MAFFHAGQFLPLAVEEVVGHLQRQFSLDFGYGPFGDPQADLPEIHQGQGLDGTDLPSSLAGGTDQIGAELDGRTDTLAGEFHKTEFGDLGNGGPGLSFFRWVFMALTTSF